MIPWIEKLISSFRSWSWNGDQSFFVDLWLFLCASWWFFSRRCEADEGPEQPAQEGPNLWIFPKFGRIKSQSCRNYRAGEQQLLRWSYSYSYRAYSIIRLIVSMNLFIRVSIQPSMISFLVATGYLFKHAQFGADFLTSKELQGPKAGRCLYNSNLGDWGKIDGGSRWVEQNW